MLGRSSSPRELLCRGEVAKHMRTFVQGRSVGAHENFYSGEKWQYTGEILYQKEVAVPRDLLCRGEVAVPGELLCRG